VGWLLGKRAPAIGRSVIVLSVLLLIGLSTPLASALLLRGLSSDSPLVLNRGAPTADAIVILGAEATMYWELGGGGPGPRTSERLRYGARLHRGLGVPILVTGGKPNPDRWSVAALMAESLSADFGVKVRWQERTAKNTYENALYSKSLLARDGIKKIYLVTHATHMRRAKAAFETVGLDVVPAPDRMPGPDVTFDIQDLVPTAHALSGSTAAIYEYLARIWYRIRYLANDA
jgi:uncharacterized SAM-binding protein YcdF (DUF218 family)